MGNSCGQDWLPACCRGGAALWFPQQARPSLLR